MIAYGEFRVMIAFGKLWYAYGIVLGNKAIIS